MASSLVARGGKGDFIGEPGSGRVWIKAARAEGSNPARERTGTAAVSASISNGRHRETKPNGTGVFTSAETGHENTSGTVERFTI
jgi:hypothetical protein